MTGAAERLSARLLPRKSLGQHFLCDPNYVRKIIGALQLKAGDAVLEIGPGEGALTKHLAGAGTLVAVEVDRRAVEKLRRELPGAVRVLHQDVLTVDLVRLASECHARDGLRVVGNVPYNLTSPILFALLEQRQAVRDALLMMQREVARRVVAGAGTKEYGILSVFMNLFADTEVLFDVPPTAFRPRPAVTSTMVHLVPLPAPRHTIVDEGFFRAMVRHVFGQRRKMLRHSLRTLAARGGWELPEEFALRQRPEDLPVKELVALSNALSTARRA
jgi:16S rRNA (adenine1518-N6/adenine1519-N6)-dimethyltransferase